MHNALSPDRMSAAERLEELASILAAGVVRLRTRKSRRLSADHGESCLHFSPDQCRHGSTETNAEESMP
ncbi:MAG: hypothetical protein CMO10_07950 [Thalassospira sp.]|nr:hypothetical protein [Thalassospira sp.]